MLFSPHNFRQLLFFPERKTKKLLYWTFSTATTVAICLIPFSNINYNTSECGEAKKKFIDGETNSKGKMCYDVRKQKIC